MQVPPKVQPLTHQDIYQDGHINLKRLSKELAAQALLDPSLLKSLLKECKKIIMNQPNIIELNDPVTIIGDIHGQLYDLLKILELVSVLDKVLFKKKGQKVIFLGDYVDRGLQSLQVVIILMAIKLQYPQQVFMLRGNHQSRTMTEQYNFRTECLDTYSQQIYELFMQFFDSLPLACIVNKSFFCVHGGISDKQATLSRINSIQRICEIPIANTLYCDLIWSDPVDNRTGYLRNKSVYNFSRDCSIVYGHTLVNDFLKENKLTSVIRAHEVFFQGYYLHEWNKTNKIPPVITVFSAPNYCGNYNNKGAILKIEDNKMKIKQIKEHEPERHKSMNFDVFSWTINEVMYNVREVIAFVTREFAKKNAPQLNNQSLETKALFFIKYSLEAKKVQPGQKSGPPIKRVPMTEEEEREYLFNRSINYYSNTQKLHKAKQGGPSVEGKQSKSQGAPHPHPSDKHKNIKFPHAKQ